MKTLDNRGMVSIIVSSIIITILALIVLSFASIMRREQQEALDRQLNTQAFYAAETAVNDVRNALYDGSLTTNIDTCDDAKTGTLQVTDSEVNPSSAITSEVGCVTVELDPEVLTFASVGTNRSETVMIEAATGPLTSLEVYFGDPDGDTSFLPAGGSLPAYGSFGSGPGLLRIELVAVPSGSYTRDDLRANTRVYLVRTNNNTAAPLTRSWAGSDLYKVNRGCDTADTSLPLPCGLIISNLPAAGVDNYLLKLRSYYQPVQAVVQGSTASGPASFVGAQAVVDATGRSNDVIFRTREVIPYRLGFDYPEFGIQAGELCKLLEAEPGTTTVATVGNSTSTDACRL